MRSLVVLLAVGALLCSSIVFAAPRALSSAELDQVTAGGAADPFVSAFVSGDPQQAADTSGTIDPLTTTGNGSPTVAGSGDTTAGAVADSGSAAMDGDCNTALGLTQNGNIAVDDAVAGNQNTTTDQSGSGVAIQTGDICIEDAFKATHTENTIEKGGAGVIGDTPTVTDSFNTSKTDNDVKVNIDDSFNTCTNTLDISGQGTVSGIINANSLGEQNIGANLNLTSASSSVPNTQPAPTGLTSLEGFGAAAFTCIDQTVVNESVGVLVGDITVIVADVNLLPLVGTAATSTTAQ